MQDTQRNSLPHLRGIGVERHDEAITIDAATRRNLEIDRSLSNQPKHTLLGILDRTRTSMGSRLLRRWLNRPLRDRNLVRERHAATQQLLEQSAHEALRDPLQAVGDIERILARIGLKSARPRDLTTLRDSLEQLPRLQEILAPFDSPLLDRLRQQAGTHPVVVELLRRALIDNPPVLTRDGGVLAKGYDESLDELRALSENANQFLLDLEAQEREQTGIAEDRKALFNQMKETILEDLQPVPRSAFVMVFFVISSFRDFVIKIK